MRRVAFLSSSLHRLHVLYLVHDRLHRVLGFTGVGSKSSMCVLKGVGIQRFLRISGAL